MPEVSTLMVFLGAAAILLVTPGPAVLYVVVRSVDAGRRAGLASTAGVAAGSLVHVAGAALGLSALLATSATAFSVVKGAGAAYLIYLGLRRILTRSDPLRPVAGADAGLGRVFAQGVIVNVLNPKAAIFFLTLLPQFVDPGRGSVAMQLAVLGLSFVLLGLVTDGAYAVVAGAAGGALRRSPRTMAASRWVGGGFLVGLGVATAVAGGRDVT